MKRRFLLAAILCLSLTACGADATPAQQPTDQITEQTAPATSICRATIMEINGNTLTVTPVEGSWELSSSDKFFLSAQHLDESVTPTVGMTLEITYDGSILETYPASFSGIETVAVIDEAPTVDVTDTHSLNYSHRSEKRSDIDSAWKPMIRASILISSLPEMSSS